jgi:D-glycero-D-manno-heptose 1,7-bisphosphate phosphatase
MNVKLIILDRDGVINEDSDNYIKSTDEWRPLPGSIEAVARLSNAGFHVVVATNQSGISRKLFDLQTLNAMHNKMHQLVAEHGGNIDAVFFCPHGPNDDCDCRKPKTGLLLEAAKRAGASLQGVPCIGDSYRDIESARAVGALPILVRTGKGTRTLYDTDNDLSDIPVYCDLNEAVNAILAGELPLYQ